MPLRTHKRNDTRASLALAEKATRAKAVNHNKAYRLLTISFNRRGTNRFDRKPRLACILHSNPAAIYIPAVARAPLSKRFGRGIAAECAINYPLCGEYARDIDWYTPPNDDETSAATSQPQYSPDYPTATNNMGYRQQWWTSKRPGRYHRRH